MRLTSAWETSDTVFAAASEAMDVRLAVGEPQPLAVAFSGGGDSLFLVVAAKRWADRRGRRLVALTVDHRVQAASGQWARRCRERCASLGVEHHILDWDGPRLSGAAAARDVRHALLADAARERGARVILMGHTKDDLRETRLMRHWGTAIPDPRTWAPSPAWPEGRGVFILRPLLGLRRADLRAALAGLGETWIDDPLNEDARFARARARQSLAEGGNGSVPEAIASPCRLDPRLLEKARFDAQGVVTIPRAVLAGEGNRLVGPILVSVSGRRRPPRSRQMESLGARLREPGEWVRTLAGARVEAGRDTVRVMREPGDMIRTGADLDLELQAGRPATWDGRFGITAHAAGLRVRPLAGVARGLNREDRGRLRATPPAARRALPAILDAWGATWRPVGDERPWVTIEALGPARLSAAAGCPDRETAVAMRGGSGPGILDGDNSMRRDHEPS